MNEQQESPQGAPRTVETHEDAMLTLASAMYRMALWPSVVTAVLCVVLFGVLKGSPGLFGALVGGVLACAASLLTPLLMRKTAAQGPHVAMAASLGGSIAKLAVLLLIMMPLRGVDALDPRSLGITMIAVVIVVAVAEAIAFRRTKLPTIIVGTGASDTTRE